MNITSVKKVSFICPECNTSISFEIPQEGNAMNELFKSVANLKCPRCGSYLHGISKEMLYKINAYNIAAKELDEFTSETNSALF